MLQHVLERDGYLRVRGVIDRAAVLWARRRVLHELRECGAVVPVAAQDAEDSDDSDEAEAEMWRADLGPGGREAIPFMEGSTSLTRGPELSAALEAAPLYELFAGLFGARPALTFDFKWLRGMPPGGFTGVHVDNVYMSRGSQSVLSCWIPLGDIPVEEGVVAVLEGGHRAAGGLSRFQETYGSCDIEAEGLEGTGWFTEDPTEVEALGGRWVTADFRAGDILIFRLQTPHMSTRNNTNRVRLSCDTRWQPSDEPTDPRYVGDAAGHADVKFGVHGKANGDARAAGVTMTDLRQRWGL